MKGVIDRFEEGYAVVLTDEGEMFNISREKLPEGAREGDVLILDGTIRVDSKETEKRRRNAKKYLDMWEE